MDAPENEADALRASRNLSIVTVSARLGGVELMAPLSREIVKRPPPHALAPQLAQRFVGAFRDRGLPVADGDYVLVGIDGTVFDRDRDFTLADFPPSSDTTDARERCQCFLWPRGQLAHRCEHPGCKEWAESTFRAVDPRVVSYHGIIVPSEMLRLCGEHAHELYAAGRRLPPGGLSIGHP